MPPNGGIFMLSFRTPKEVSYFVREPMGAQYRDGARPMRVTDSGAASVSGEVRPTRHFYQKTPVSPAPVTCMDNSTVPRNIFISPLHRIMIHIKLINDYRMTSFE